MRLSFPSSLFLLRGRGSRLARNRLLDSRQAFLERGHYIDDRFLGSRCVQLRDCATLHFLGDRLSQPFTILILELLWFELDGERFYKLDGEGHFLLWDHSVPDEIFVFTFDLVLVKQSVRNQPTLPRPQHYDLISPVHHK